MMYKFIFFVLISIGGYAQDELLNILPLKDAKICYSNVLEVKGSTEEALIKNAIDWLENSDFNFDYKAPDNNKNEILNHIGSFKELWGPNNFTELYVEILFTIDFKFKHDRYQYEITNFVVKDANSEVQLEIYKMNHRKYVKYNRDFYLKIDYKIREMTRSIEKNMTRKMR